MKWTALADHSQVETRMQLLSERLNQSGLPNKMSFEVVKAENLDQRLRAAMTQFDQIRIEGAIKEKVIASYNHLPLDAKQIGSVDAVEKVDGFWWPRNLQSDAIHRSIVSNADSANLNGSAFVIGKGSELLSSIAALVRLGFHRISIADPSEERGVAFVNSLKRTYFGIDFQFIKRHMMTQLPSVHGVGINQINSVEFPEAVEELVYFNFLAPGGVWIDVPLYPPNRTIISEAEAIGAHVESSARVAAAVDEIWAKRVSPGTLQFDFAAHATALDQTLE